MLIDNQNLIWNLGMKFDINLFLQKWSTLNFFKKIQIY